MAFGSLQRGATQRLICIALAASMASAPSMNLIAETTAATPTSASQPKPAAAGGTIDTTYVTSGAMGLAVMRPAQLMKSKAGEMLPVEVATAAGMKFLGLDPANIEEATAFLDASNPMAPSYGLTLKFSQPLTALKLAPEIRAHTRPDKLNGKTYLKSQQVELPSFYAPNKSTLVIAPDQTCGNWLRIHQRKKQVPLSTGCIRYQPEATSMWLSTSRRCAHSFRWASPGRSFRRTPSRLPTQ
jgi:hypothetical protein